MTAVMAAALAAGCLVVVSAEAQDKLPSRSDQSCLKCHEYDKASNILAGKFVDVANKSKSIQLQIDQDMEIIFFDDSTVLKNAPSLKEIPKQESVRIVYSKKDGKLFADQVEVKKGLEVPKDELIAVEQLAELVAKGPDKGKYVLLDSRPEEMFNQGHIPSSLSMPFFAFDKLQEKLLPKDKDVMQIYYCAGFS
jgi:hypothetical protein